MDPELVHRAQRGDQQAFELITLEIYERLHLVAHGIVRDPSLAEDAIQQTVLTVWRQLPKLRDSARFEAWSYRILVNACHAESRRLRRFVSGIEGRLRDRYRTSDETAVVLDRDQLERAYGRLSVDHRAVVVLRYYIDLPIGDIADALDIPVGTVNSRLHHALRLLRASLDADARISSADSIPPEVIR
jgi:RNA polymerase sigma-70 factor (ECF subfamily)